MVAYFRSVPFQCLSATECLKYIKPLEINLCFILFILGLVFGAFFFFFLLKDPPEFWQAQSDAQLPKDPEPTTNATGFFFFYRYKTITCSYILPLESQHCSLVLVNWLSRRNLLHFYLDKMTFVDVWREKWRGKSTTQRQGSWDTIDVCVTCTDFTVNPKHCLREIRKPLCSLNSLTPLFNCRSWTEEKEQRCF